MTVDELVKWMRKVEPDGEAHAVRSTIESLLADPVEAARIAMFAEPMRGTDYESYLLAFGHYIALADVAKQIEAGSWPAKPRPEEVVQ